MTCCWSRRNAGCEVADHGFDPSTDKRVGSVKIAKSHVTGIAICGPTMWPRNKSCAFVQSKKGKEGHSDYIRKYSLDTLRTAMKEDGQTQHVYDAGFLSSNQGYVWAGRWKKRHHYWMQ